MTEAVKSAVDRLAYLFRCGTSRATELAFCVGSPAWSRCVRARDHNSDCVMGLTPMEQKVIDGTHEPHYMMVGKRTEDGYMLWLRVKARLAEEAWGT